MKAEGDIRTVRRLRKEKEDLERSLCQRTAELEAAHKELETFSHSISHDLRAPLRAMNGFAALLQQACGSSLPPEAAHLLERIRTNAAQMSELVDGLLNFSTLSFMPVTRKKVDPKVIVRSVWHDLQGVVGKREVQFVMGELRHCHADPMLLQQVFTHLLSNAVKYSRSRNPAVIQVASRNEGGRCVYYVSDNGVGFDMQYADKLFGVFQRMHSTDDFEGTGVGLAIVQRIIQRHGGRIWAASEPDNGATFSFTLEEERTDEPIGKRRKSTR